MKIYTNNSHEIIGYSPDYVPEEYAHEYEVEEDLVGNRSFPVMCGYKYEPQYELDFDENGALKYGDQGNLIYKLGEDGEKIFAGYSFYPFIDSQVLTVLQREADARSSDLATISRENSTLRTAATFAAISFTDAQALAVKELYPKWSSLPDGEPLTKQEDAVKGTEITKVLGDDGKLYKVITSHNKQSDWAPGKTTESLFTVIDEEHSGTVDDPIPYSINMVVYNGKYYSYNGVIYLCIRDSGIALQYTPDQLLDNYFSLATN